MLIEFTVGNYLSFKEKTILSLEATAIKEHTSTNVFSEGRYDLLKGAVIYGANASGKSNFIKAMSTMRRLIVQSFEQSSMNELAVTPFLLSTETEQAPSFFEAVFLIEAVRYRYGFEVDNQTVQSEWLFEARKEAEKALFVREKDGIEVMGNAFPEGKDLEQRTRDNALFLSVVDRFNGTISKRIMKWFNNFITISGLSHELYRGVTFGMLENKKTQSLLLDFYKNLDLGFQEIALNRRPIKEIDFFAEAFEGSDIDENSVVTIKTFHKKFDAGNKEKGYVQFDMRSQESAGTNKLFNISGSVFEVLHNGGVLVIDEFEASLHPLLTLAVTKLFNSHKINLKNAQLIFATHDTNLLHYGNYRRDQVFFVEKNELGVSEMYSLVEYKEEGKTIRKDRSFEKDYIQGRYGAIPYIGNISNALQEWQEK